MWTARASAWWPVAHTVSRSAGLEVVFGPHVGGRIFERTGDGMDIVWGEVTTWDPPGRLGYLWHIATDRSDATDVDIAFTEIEPSLTRVEIEHRGWERLGAEKGQTWRDANCGGWDGLLPAFVAVCASGSHV